MTDATTNKPVLAVESLTTSFKTPEGWKAVIRNISLHVDAGETVAIVGERLGQECHRAIDNAASTGRSGTH